jgi:hypothetical protein
MNTIPETTEPVVAESYDEVVFTDPTESFFGQLQRIATGPTVEYSQREHFSTNNYSDHDICTALLGAQKFLQHELSTVKNRLLTVDAEMQQVDTALREQARKLPTQHRPGGAAATSSVRASAPTTAATRPPPTKKAKTS